MIINSGSLVIAHSIEQRLVLLSMLLWAGAGGGGVTMLAAINISGQI